VRWCAEFLAQRTRAALLLYLAVAHYGRGRGDWVQGEAPAHWLALGEDVVRAREGAWQAAWRAADEGTPADELAVILQPGIAAAAREMLVRLYPAAREMLA
jgi:hypothetical protein